MCIFSVRYCLAVVFHQSQRGAIGFLYAYGCEPFALCAWLFSSYHFDAELGLLQTYASTMQPFCIVLKKIHFDGKITILSVKLNVPTVS